MFTGSLEKSRAAVHRSNATTLKSLAIQEMLTNPGAFDANTLSASTWKVSGKYNFDEEKFEADITIVSDAKFQKISASGGKAGIQNDNNIGKVPTSGTVEYTVWVNRTDYSELAITQGN